VIFVRVRMFISTRPFGRSDGERAADRSRSRCED
jgi:hypothetical protein